MIMLRTMLLLLSMLCVVCFGCDDASRIIADGEFKVNENNEVIPRYIYRHSPANDIKLKVPEHLVFTPRVIGSLPHGVTSGYVNSKHFSDEQETLSTRFVGAINDRIYVSDWRGVNIYAFDVNGNFLEDETINRRQLSCENYADYANQSNFGDKVIGFFTTDRFIYMTISKMWDCTGTNWREDVGEHVMVRININSKNITETLLQNTSGILAEDKDLSNTSPFLLFGIDDVLYARWSKEDGWNASKPDVDKKMFAYDVVTYQRVPEKDVIFGYKPLDDRNEIRITSYAKGYLWRLAGSVCSPNPAIWEWSVKQNPEDRKDIPTLEGRDLRSYCWAWDRNGEYTGIFLEYPPCMYDYYESDHDPEYIWHRKTNYGEYPSAGGNIIEIQGQIYIPDFSIGARHSDKVNVSDEEGIPAVYWLRAFR